MNELSRKEYQRLLESPDFVIMFIPNEPAFLAAMQHDSAIWSDAYERKGHHFVAYEPLRAAETRSTTCGGATSSRATRSRSSKSARTLYEQFVAFAASARRGGAGASTWRAPNMTTPTSGSTRATTTSSVRANGCAGWGFRPRNVLRGGCWTKRTDWMPRRSCRRQATAGHDRQ